jgi:hypothetical protein
MTFKWPELPQPAERIKVLVKLPKEYPTPKTKPPRPTYMTTKKTLAKKVRLFCESCK